MIYLRGSVGSVEGGVVQAYVDIGVEAQLLIYYALYLTKPPREH